MVSLRALALLLIVGGILTGGHRIGDATSRPRTNHRLRNRGKCLTIPGKKKKLLKEFRLTDRSGKLFGTQELAGTVHVASFFFASCPNTCFSQNKAIETLESQFKGKPVKFLSISCNPEADTPDVLKDYAKRFNAPRRSMVFPDWRPQYVHPAHRYGSNT